VRVEYSGSRVVETALLFRPDAVLLDLGLPGMNGYEVAKTLHEEPRLRGLRLIAVTGYGQEADRQRSQEAGFDAHMVKPVEPGKLNEILSSILAQRT